MAITKKLIQDAKKAYKNIAEIKIENNKLVIRNTTTNACHPFIDGDLFKLLSNQDIINISNWNIL